MNGTIFQPLMLLLLGILIKTTSLLLTAWMACLLLRRSSAAMRHFVWSAALIGVLLLPLLTLSLPHWEVAFKNTAVATTQHFITPDTLGNIQSESISNSSNQTALPTPTSSQAAMQGNVTASAVPQSISNPRPRHWVSISMLCAIAVSIVWVMGFFLIVMQFFTGLFRLRRVRNQAVPLDGLAYESAEQARRHLSVRPVTFLRAAADSEVAVPITWGLFRPIVLLSAQSDSWSAECLRAALLHELAHIRRWDWATQLAARLACAVYWWHPLVWLAARQAREESERACDDMVLGIGITPADYAQRLIEVVRSMPNDARLNTVAIAMAQPSEVEVRVSDLLAKGRNRKNLNQRVVFIMTLMFGMTLLPIATLRMVAHAQSAAPKGDLLSIHKPSIPRGRLEFVYFKEVACPRDQHRPIQINISNPINPVGTTFFDRRTGQAFRDLAHLKTAFTQLLAQGHTRRPGATVFRIPNTLMALTDVKAVYFTVSQQQSASGLGDELKAWRALLGASPLILSESDIKPNVTVTMTGRTLQMPSLELEFTPGGSQKFAAYTTAHVGELMGIIIDDGCFEAPVINEPILGNKSEISYGFRSLADAKKLAARLNGSEIVTVNPTESQRDLPTGIVGEQPGEPSPVMVANSSRVVLPNGYQVSLGGVTQATRIGSEWDMYGGPWWLPDGVAIAPQNAGMNGHWHWTTTQTHGFAPYTFRIGFNPHTGWRPGIVNNTSFFLQFLGALKPAAAADVSVSSPLADDSDPKKFSSFFAGVLPSELYPVGIRSCTVRCGVATGPWHTATTSPAAPAPVIVVGGINQSHGTTTVSLALDGNPRVICADNQGRSRVFYFAGSLGRLSYVVWRLGAFDVAGHPVVVRQFSFSRMTLTTGKRTAVISTAPGKPDTTLWTMPIDLNQIKEFHLETCAYEIVEFRNVQLQPTSIKSVDPGILERWRTKEQINESNMRHISAALQQYAQDHDGNLPSLKTTDLLESELGLYLAFQMRFPDPVTNQPYPDFGKNVFISPLTGKPYRFKTELSGTSVSKISLPTYTVLFADTSCLDPNGKNWLVEAFADGHVKGHVVP